MTKQEILLKRFNFIKQMWLNSVEGSSEQDEWERKMDICLKEMKKANSDANPATNVMMRYTKSNIRKD